MAEGELKTAADWQDCSRRSTAVGCSNGADRNYFEKRWTSLKYYAIMAKLACWKLQRKNEYVNMIQQVKNVFMIVWKYAKGVFVANLFFTVLTALLAPAGVKATQYLIDSMIGFAGGNMTWHPVLAWACIMVSILLLGVAVSAANQWLGIACDKRLINNYEPVLLRKYRHLAYSNYENEESQNIIHRMAEQPYMRIRNTFTQVMNVIQNIIMLIALIVIYMDVSIFLVLFMAVLLVPKLLASHRANHLWWMLYSQQAEEERRLEYLDSILTTKASLFELKVYRAIDYLVNLWNQKVGDMLEQKFKVQKKSQRFVFLSDLISVIWYCVLIITLLVGFINHRITLGLFVSLIAYSESVIQKIGDLAGGFSDFTREIMEMRFYARFMELPEYEEPAGTEQTILPEIKFENVHFSYPDTDKEVLKGLSFSIKPLESVGIVGVNGAGKSTIIKLLCKLYTPDEGRILVGGVDLQELSYKNLRALFCVVFQDYFCYELTLRENLALGNLQLLHEDEKLQEALLKSGLKDLYETSAKGLNINLGKLEDDGTDLSGGQWQRIAISRVYASDVPFIVLDEPTASLDPIAESEMYSLFLDTIRKKRGAIMISHRLASARMADKIIVMHDGIVAETGTHDELMRSNGIYHAMFTEQASWYRKEEVR